MVRGNAELLRRALENVVRNAIKYSHEGGRIDVRAAVTGGSSLGVTVSDAGPGVAAADLAAIFEPFYRAANGTGADGHGLGLAIAKRIIEAHGGSIRATNRAGGGLQVAITLPVRAT
jgi:signal transduction histidine kinase